MEEPNTTKDSERKCSRSFLVDEDDIIMCDRRGVKKKEKPIIAGAAEKEEAVTKTTFGPNRHFEESDEEAEGLSQSLSSDDSLVAGAFAVRQGGEPSRRTIGDYEDNSTLVETLQSSEDPSTMATPSTQSALLVQAQLAQEADDLEERVAHLEQENSRLRQRGAAPLVVAQAEAAQATDSSPIENGQRRSCSNNENTKRYVLPLGGVAIVFAIIAITVSLSAISGDDNGTSRGDTTRMVKQATGLSMSLIGVHRDFDEQDAELWARSTEEHVESYFSDSGQRRDLSKVRDLETNKNSVKSIETTLEVTNTNLVVQGNNLTANTLQLTYNQALSYTIEGQKYDISINDLVTEPFRTLPHRSEYAKGIQAAARLAGNDIFDDLIGTSPVFMPTTNVPSSTPTPAPVATTEHPTASTRQPHWEMTPDSTLRPTNEAPDAGQAPFSAPEPTPRPNPRPTPGPTNERTPDPTLEPTHSPSVLPTNSPPTNAPTGSLVSLLPNGSWLPLGQTINGIGHGDNFGCSTALSKDGSIMAIGANEEFSSPHRGYVSVFQYDQTTQTWYHMGQDLVGSSSDAGFGTAVSLNGDGTILAVGGPRKDIDFGETSNTGHVIVYEYNGAMARWVQLGNELTGQDTDESFGGTVSLSGVGDIVAVGQKSRAGSVHLFQFNSGDSLWNPLGQNLLGMSVTLNHPGTVVAVAGQYNDTNGVLTSQLRAYEYNMASSLWSPFGTNAGLVVNSSGWSYNLDRPVFDESGLFMVVGTVFACGSTRAICFRLGPEIIAVAELERVTSNWTLRGQFFPDDRWSSWSLSGNGNVMATSYIHHSEDERQKIGQADIFQYDAILNQWIPLGDPLKGVDENDRLGTSISFSSNGTIVGVGVQRPDGSGSVHVYSLY